MRADGDPALGGGLGRELEGVTGAKNSCTAKAGIAASRGAPALGRREAGPCFFWARPNVTPCYGMGSLAAPHLPRRLRPAQPRGAPTAIG